MARPEGSKGGLKQKEIQAFLGTLVPGAQKDPRDEMALEQRAREEMQQAWTQGRQLIGNNAYGEPQRTRMTVK